MMSVGKLRRYAPVWKICGRHDFVYHDADFVVWPRFQLPRLRLERDRNGRGGLSFRQYGRTARGDELRVDPRLRAMLIELQGDSSWLVDTNSTDWSGLRRES